MIRTEYQQEQKVHENEANSEQLKSEKEKIQRRQREFPRQKEKGTRTAEQATAGLRPESRMEVDEVPRSSGRFNLDRAAQEHMNEGLELWIPPEPVSSVRSTPIPPFSATGPLSSRLGAKIDSRDSSRGSRTRQPGSTPMEAEEAESSKPQSSVVSSVVVVDNKQMERPAELSRRRYPERIKELDLEDERG